MQNEDMDDLGVAVLNTSSHSEDEDSPPAESREVEDDVSASASFKDPLPKSMTAQEKKIKQQRLDRIRRLNLALESPTEEMIAKRTNTLLDLTKSSNKALMTSPLTPATPVTSTSTSLASLFMSEEADTPILNSPRPSSSRSTPSDWNKENLVPTSDHETTPKSSLGIPPLKSVSSNSQRKASPELALMKKPEVPRSKARKRLGIFENGCRRSMSLEDVDQGSSAPKIRKQQTSYIVKNANPKFHRSYSETNATAIMNACNRSSSSVLTADAAQKLALPTLSLKKHQDLNTIDSHTVAKLIRGEFASSIASYRIIDARYVYEFEGGHIKGAENFGLWEEETFFEEFLPSALKPLPPGSHEANQENQFAMRKNVLIFHCEFSSKRGPALARDLRRRDRTLNSDSYPALYYPEIYLLHNGYKEFWENYPGLCEPQSYLMMTDSRFTAQEKTFRTKSKSGGAGGAGTVARTDMKMVRANSMKAKTNRLFLDSPEAAGPSKKSTSIKSSLFPSPASRLKEDEAKKIAEEDEGEEIEGDGEKKVAEDKEPKKDAEEQSS